MSRFGFSRLFKRRTEQEAEEFLPSEGSKGEAAWLKPEPGTKVLIVDDSKTIHAVLKRQLSRQGYECISAYDGSSAVEIARQLQPALILMDVVMPRLNGFQATREIRKDSNPTVAEIPVIIMSGNAQPSEELWSVKIRANAFIAKPFGEDELFSNMERLLYPHAAS